MFSELLSEVANALLYLLRIEIKTDMAYQDCIMKYFVPYLKKNTTCA
jgi:hypothetical protein